MKQIRSTILDTCANNKGCSKRLLWDTLKCTMRGTCIGYAAKRNKLLNKRRYELQTELTTIKENLAQVHKVQNEADIATLKTRLELLKAEQHELISEETKGAALRSQYQYYEEGDKSTKFFLNLEKARGARKQITRLKTMEGKTVTSNQEILTEEVKYYTKLYKSTETTGTDTDKLLHNICSNDSNKITEECNKELDKDISEEEIRKIMVNSPKDKSPGSDGFTTEFYIAFWPEIKHPLMESYREAIQDGTMSITQKQGVISLIPKPNKDPEELKNWRPITLLNQDYKYLAKCVADRCKDLVPKIISTDQTGFVNGRYIGTNIIRIQNLIAHCTNNGINGTLINVDFEKAFDSIEWKFIYKALTYFGFSEKFIKLIKMFYKDIETCITNNGHISQFFKPSRGVRQGCPLSPTIFVIPIELLAIYLKNSPEIEGIKSKDGSNYLVSQFADDTSLAIINKPGSIAKTLELLDNFTSISGLKINVDKSEILMLGICTMWDIPTCHRMLVKDSVKILGINIHQNPETTNHLNYEPVKAKMKSLLDIWSKRKLSLAGKICVLKTLILSQIIYCLTVLPTPSEEYLSEINTMMFRFIANNKPEKLKRETLIGDYKEGGFKMTDIYSQESAIKACWMKRLANNAGVWRELMLEKIQLVDYRYLLRSNIAYEDLPFKLPATSIWASIWKAWCRTNYKQEILHLDEILNQTLWFNSQIRVGGKAAYNRRWSTHDIMWINNIVKGDGPYTILNREEIEEKYHCNIPYLEYYSLISAIPKQWKKILTARTTLDDTDLEDYKLFDRIDDTRHPSRIVYNIMLAKRFAPPTNKAEKWSNILNQEVNTSALLQGLERGRVCTISSKLRSFNYNFFMCNIPYESRLFNMKIKPTNECQHCRVKESILQPGS